MLKTEIIKEGVFFGLRNESHNELLPCNYHSVFKINQHLFGYRIGKRWGIIKSNGEIVIPPVLNALIEREDNSDEYQKYIANKGFLSVENPFTFKINDQFLKSYFAMFIEELMENHEGENYIISEDNMGKVFIGDLTGKILLHEKLDALWKVDMDSWFVIFKDDHANIWNCRTNTYLLKSFIHSSSFHQNEFGIIFFTYHEIDYMIDNQSTELRILNMSTDEVETNWD